MLTEHHTSETLGKYPSSIFPIVGAEGKYLIPCERSVDLWCDGDGDNHDQAVSINGPFPSRLGDHTAPFVKEEWLDSLRFNDAKCDLQGRLWIGTMDIHDRPNRAGLYRYRPNGFLSVKGGDSSRTLELGWGPTTLSNGLDWSLNGDRMYFIDTPERAVQVFEYDVGSGSIIREVGRIDLSENVPGMKGVPDGMTVDRDGNLWVSMWNGSMVVKVDPEYGKPIEWIKLPTSRPTTCVFGGENLDTLYISSAAVEGEANSGRIQITRPKWNVKGRPSRPWNPKAEFF